MKDYTDITIVLDRSGSMSSVRNDTVGGFNTFLDEQVKCPVPCKISVYQFDNYYDVMYEGKSPEEAPRLNEKNYVPRGSTALLDAMGRTINAIGARLAAMSEDDRPNKVLLVFLSDGYENASLEFKDSAVIADMIKHYREVYNWEFLFLGADMDAISAGSTLGFAKHQTANVNKNDMKGSFARLSSARSAYSTTGNMDYNKS